jgi:putative membrane protein
MILVWVLIIGLAVLLVRAVAGSSSGSGGGKSARQILDERFARGEIDQREYDERRHMLE